jgi:peptide/nickel transport system substrate-binding protein
MRLRLATLLAAAAIVFAACGSTPATSAPTTGPGVTSGATSVPTTAAASAGTSAAASGGTGSAANSISITRFGSYTPEFHPIYAEANQYLTYYLIFDTLVDVDLSDKSMLTNIPDLAASWTSSPDGSTYTFKLASGVTWQDGKPFDANDVAFTANWAAENRSTFDTGFAPPWYSLKGAADAQAACDKAPTDVKACGGGVDSLIPGIKVIDPQTIQFTTEAPNVLFLEQATNAVATIMPAHLLSGMTGQQVLKSDFLNKSPIGTGPYKLSRVVTGQFTEFDANPTYFRGAPKIDKIFYKDITPDQGLAQLQTGDLDIATNTGAANTATLQGISTVTTEIVPTPGYLAMYTWDETPAQRAAADYIKKGGLKPGFPFWSKEVRQAVYYAIDRRGIDQAIYKGQNPTVWNPPGYLNTVAGLNQYAYDPQKAKDLLATAAKTPGVDLTQPIRLLCTSDTNDNSRICPIIKQQLEAVGLKVNIMSMTQAAANTYTADLTNRENYDAEFIAGGGGIDPSSSSFHIACDTGAHNNILFDTGYVNCDLLKQYNQALATPDVTARNKIWDQIAQTLNDEQPLLYLWQVSGVHAVNKRVQGVTIPQFDRDLTMNAYQWTVSQ